MNSKQFYESHKNFSLRSSFEYFLSPGIKCKIDLIWEKIREFASFENAVDIGCSGNSILALYNSSNHNSYLDLAHYPLKEYINHLSSHPICGDIVYLPYRDNTFDLVCALDVIEHVKNDLKAIQEIKRIMKSQALAVISVPHRKKYYSYQDTLIGHYRRYELKDIVDLFNNNKLKVQKVFGIYGLLMFISQFQGKYPNEIEKGMIRLREKYSKNVSFQVIWKILMSIMTKIMKLDAKFQALSKIMNIAFILKKY